MAEVVTEEEWRLMRKPATVVSTLTDTQMETRAAGFAKSREFLKFIQSNPWVKRSPLSERCVNEALAAYNLESREIQRTEVDPNAPCIRCCLCDRLSNRLYQVRFTRYSRTTPMITHNNTTPQTLTSDWFTIHPSYLPFMYALLYVSRSLSDSYLSRDPDPSKLYSQLWGGDGFNASRFIQCVMVHHSSPPEWHTVKEAAEHIKDSPLD